MSCGCKGAPQGAAEYAGKALVAYNINALVTFQPCADCAKDGAKSFALTFSVGTGAGDNVDERLELALAGLKAATEAAKAKHEAH